MDRKRRSQGGKPQQSDEREPMRMERPRRDGRTAEAAPATGPAVVKINKVVNSSPPYRRRRRDPDGTRRRRPAEESTDGDNKDADTTEAKDKE